MVLYIHGKGGSAEEAEHYVPLFPGEEVLGFDYRAETPWEAKEEFDPFVSSLCGIHGPVILIANSVGAFFAMCAGLDAWTKRAFFVSPVADMEKLITGMMAWAGVTEEELRKKGTIPTDFGETLSWEYLTWIREHPVRWKAPTEILYGEKDALIPRDTVSAFAARIGAGLTVMEGGEHWFHTEEQMRFLDEWIRVKSKGIRS